MGVTVGVLGIASTVFGGVREPYVPDVGVTVTQNEMTRAQKLEELTPAARATVEQTIGNDQVRSVNMTTRTGVEAYRVELCRKPDTAFYPTLIVGQDGTLLRQNHMEDAATIGTPLELDATSNR